MSEKFKFDEDKFLKEIENYISSTYGEHYVEDDGIQFMDLIMADSTFGTGFLKHNVSKYVLRYGKKEGFNKKDLLKAAHYLVLLWYKVDKDERRTATNEIKRKNS